MRKIAEKLRTGEDCPHHHVQLLVTREKPTVGKTGPPVPKPNAV